MRALVDLLFLVPGDRERTAGPVQAWRRDALVEPLRWRRSEGRRSGCRHSQSARQFSSEPHGLAMHSTPIKSCSGRGLGHCQQGLAHAEADLQRYAGLRGQRAASRFSSPFIPRFSPKRASPDRCHGFCGVGPLRLVATHHEACGGRGAESLRSAPASGRSAVSGNRGSRSCRARLRAKAASDTRSEPAPEKMDQTKVAFQRWTMPCV